jgi:hypothetical protein
MSLVDRRDVSGDALAIHGNTQTPAMGRVFPAQNALYMRSWATCIVPAYLAQLNSHNFPEYHHQYMMDNREY